MLFLQGNPVAEPHKSQPCCQAQGASDHDSQQATLLKLCQKSSSFPDGPPVRTSTHPSETRLTQFLSWAGKWVWESPNLSRNMLVPRSPRSTWLSYTYVSVCLCIHAYVDTPLPRFLVNQVNMHLFKEVTAQRAPLLRGPLFTSLKSG